MIDMEANPKISSDTSKSPKLFISYSWSSAQHEHWVLQLATQLRESSVDVILDKWDLKEGNDSYAFMEQMATDPDIKKVVLICDRKYAEKADQRSGGVGTEAQIISPEIYQKQDQNKFVAVIAEKNENGNPYLPTYYKSRIYIDLSDNEQYSNNFEQLLRWIYDKPLFTKPELGTKPSFLDESASISLGTSSRFSRAIEAIRNTRPYMKGSIDDYFEIFTTNLERFRIRGDGGEFDDKVLDSINSFIPSRNEAIEIFLAISQYANLKECHLQLHRFFERLIPYLDRPENVQSFQEWDFDNFKFIVHELFLYCIASFLKHEAFDGVAYLLRNRYFVARNLNYGRNSMVSFQVFRPYLRSLEFRKSRLKLNRLSLHADLLKQRCTAIGIDFEHVMLADFVLYLRGCLDAVNTGSSQGWWPYSLLWIAGNERPFEIFARSESREYFETMRVMFDVKRKEEFSAIFTAINEGKLKAPYWDYREVDIGSLMGFDSIATRS